VKPLHPPTLRHGAQLNAGMFDEMIVDNFAGAGGASMGIEAAVGRAVDVAINHDKHSIWIGGAN
jgi:DNA (cytosine-5)-methyltransferase 1